MTILFKCGHFCVNHNDKLWENNLSGKNRVISWINLKKELYGF